VDNRQDYFKRVESPNQLYKAGGRIGLHILYYDEVEILLSRDHTLVVLNKALLLFGMKGKRVVRIAFSLKTCNLLFYPINSVT